MSPNTNEYNDYTKNEKEEICSSNHIVNGNSHHEQ